ncbi:MAG: VOC family protein [Haliscomenobacter sp.]|nr:VOC family protein [Haliscomenobacter sp.]
MNHPMYPCLWFDQNAQEAAAFYCSVFPIPGCCRKTRWPSPSW